MKRTFNLLFGEMLANLLLSWKVIRLMSYKKPRIKKIKAISEQLGVFIYTHTHQTTTVWYNIKTEQTYIAVSNDYNLDRWNFS